jgi:hypothetical protein
VTYCKLEAEGRDTEQLIAKTDQDKTGEEEFYFSQESG